MFKLFKKSSPGRMFKNHSDEEYYTHLFTKSESWSKPEPNEEEFLRWQVIEKFLYYIKGINALEQKELNNILDLGCGRGWLTQLLSNFAMVQGVEPVAPVVEYANKIYPGLDIKVGNSNSLLECNNFEAFDLVVSSEVIEHVPDKSKPEFVRNIRTLLKPDGFAIITTPRKDAEEEWKKYVDPSQPIEDWLTEKKLGELFLNEGFKKRLLERLSIPPRPGAPLIEIYQLWLFRK